MKIHFLGGLGEIGSNCTIYHFDDLSLIVDFGIKFPRIKNIGIDKIFPNPSYLPKTKKVLVITHIHEDHIGAFFEVYSKVDHIYLTKLAFEFLKEKSKKELIASKFTIYDFNSVIDLSEKVQIYPFETYHSTPETYGLFIKEDSTLVTHLSDFKSDKRTIFKSKNSHFHPDGSKLIKHIFLSDSTNMSSVKEHDKSEEEVALGIEKILCQNYKRYFITLFGSNIDRIHNIQKICAKIGLTYSFLGNSLLFYQKISQHLEPKPVQIAKQEPRIFFVTGSQGEKFSQLWLMARDQGDQHINKDDALVFSSRPIPGNDQSFYHMLNLLSHKTENIFMDGEENLHCSGHAHRGDIRVAVSELRPTHVLPIHGESFQLARACRFISNDLSTPSTKAYPNSVFDTDSMLLSRGDALENDHEIYIDQNGSFPISKDESKLRTKMGQRGIVIISKENKKVQLLGCPSSQRIADQLNHEINSYSKSDTMLLTLIKRRLEEKLGYVPMIIHS